MKKSSILILVLLCTCLTFPLVKAAKITKGEVSYSSGHYLEGQAIPTGFDIFGYNYQGHMFKGYYCNAYLGGAGLPPYTGSIDDYPDDNLSLFQNHWTYPYRDVWLMMKWNDAWLSNQDRDDDGALDRYWGFDSYIGSGAWLTNHMWGTNPDGSHWNYFVKIVAAPSDAYVGPPSWPGYQQTWYSSDGTEIGKQIWGAFAVILQISNDPLYDEHGCIYNPPSPTGFGCYFP